jgi:Ser/Thr protein kinase RdoA (MazF antagonist)
LAEVHAAAANYDGPPSRYRLDLDHLLRRPLAAFLALPTLPDEERPFFGLFAARLDAIVSERATALASVACHGDCHGGNAKIEEAGLLGRRATFFDFDDGGPGWLAYDLAVFRWSQALNASPGSEPLWPSFLSGYRSVRPIDAVDLEAVPLFVAVRHFWLLGEYARRVGEWGSESLPAVWIKRQADFLRRWDESELSGRLF